MFDKLVESAGNAFNALFLLGLVLILVGFVSNDSQSLNSDNESSASGVFAAKPSEKPFGAENDSRILSDQELETFLEQASWPLLLWAEAKRVIRCESGGDPFAESHTGDYGLMQVNFERHSDKILSAKFLYDPLTNLKVSLRVFLESAGESWEPWRASNHCHRLLG